MVFSGLPAGSPGLSISLPSTVNISSIGMASLPSMSAWAGRVRSSMVGNQVLSIFTPSLSCALRTLSAPA